VDGGCITTDDDSASYGNAFNTNYGGVSATQWDSDFIRVWFWPSGTTPDDIKAGTPNPTTWGLPIANFEGTCDIDSHFVDNKIIFDTNFCTTAAETAFQSDATCTAQADTCRDFVGTNPGAFNQR
jgi:hypothetical protein